MHRRRAIREAMVALVTGLPITGANVTQGRVYPVDTDGLPSLDVTTTEESRELVVQTEPDESRMVTVEVTARAGGDTYITQLDDIALEVEQAIGADRKLGGIVDQLRLSATSLEITNEVGETPLGQLTLSWEATYSVRSIDPQ